MTTLSDDHWSTLAALAILALISRTSVAWVLLTKPNCPPNFHAVYLWNERAWFCNIGAN